LKVKIFLFIIVLNIKLVFSIEKEKTVEFTYDYTFRRYGYNPPRFQFVFPRKMLTKALDVQNMGEELEEYYSGHTLLIINGNIQLEFPCRYDWTYMDIYQEHFTFITYFCKNEKRFGFMVKVEGEVLTPKRPEGKWKQGRVVLSPLVYPDAQVDDEDIQKLYDILKDYKAYSLIPKAWKEAVMSGRQVRTVLRPSI
jgi:hypothetical protein